MVIEDGDFASQNLQEGIGPTQHQTVRKLSSFWR